MEISPVRTKNPPTTITYIPARILHLARERCKTGAKWRGEKAKTCLPLAIEGITGEREFDKAGAVVEDETAVGGC